MSDQPSRFTWGDALAIAVAVMVLLLMIAVGRRGRQDEESIFD